MLDIKFTLAAFNESLWGRWLITLSLSPSFNDALNILVQEIQIRSKTPDFAGEMILKILG